MSDLVNRCRAQTIVAQAYGAQAQDGAAASWRKTARVLFELGNEIERLEAMVLQVGAQTDKVWGARLAHDGLNGAVPPYARPAKDWP